MDDEDVLRAKEAAAQQTHAQEHRIARHQLLQSWKLLQVVPLLLRSLSSVCSSTPTVKSMLSPSPSISELTGPSVSGFSSFTRRQMASTSSFL